MNETQKCMCVYRGNVLPSTLKSLKFISYWGSSTDSFSHRTTSSSVQLCTDSKDRGEKTHLKNVYFNTFQKTICNHLTCFEQKTYSW